MQSSRQQFALAQCWAHMTRAMPTNIDPSQYFSSTSHKTGHICKSQPSVMQSSYSSLLPLRAGSYLQWHSAEPIGLVGCQKRLLPHSTSLPPARRLATSAFRGFPWCDPFIPLSSLSKLSAISNGTALSSLDSCCANKDCSPTVLLFHQPGDWPHLNFTSFHDAILLFLFSPSQSWQQSPIAQRWADRTRAMPTKIAPPQYFSSTSQETGHICLPRTSVMWSS